MGIEQCFLIVLIYIALMTNDTEYSFMCLLAIWIFSLLNVYSNLLLIFIGLFVFLLLGYMHSLHVPESSPLSDMCVANVCSLSAAYLFIFSASIAKQICKILTLFNNCFFLWCLMLSVSSLNHLCLFQGHKDAFLFSCRSFVVLQGIHRIVLDSPCQPVFLTKRSWSSVLFITCEHW